MNKKLERKLKNLNVQKIDFPELKNIIFRNKDFRTTNYLVESIDWLIDNNIKVTNIPKTDAFAKFNENKEDQTIEEEDAEYDTSEMTTLEEVEEIEKEIEEEDKASNYTEINTSSDYILNLYIGDVSAIKRKNLTKEEEVELFKKYHNGDESAKQELIERNLRLVLFCARKYANKSLKLSIMDIIQEGNTGLLIALDKFDYTMGFRFATYAVWWIINGIKTAIANNGKTIRIPIHTTEQALAVLKAKSALMNKTGKEPTFEEIADYCNKNDLNKNVKRRDGVKPPLTAAQAKKFLFIYQTELISIDTPTGENEDDNLYEFLEDKETESPESYTDRLVLRDQIEEVMNQKLNKRERIMVKLRYGWDDDNPKTYVEIGEMFGVTKQCIESTVKRALKKLSKSTKLKIPKTKEELRWWSTR